MKVLIIGGGQLGFHLSKNLLENGYEVKLIDSDKEACKEAADRLDIPVIWGDGTSAEAMKEGIKGGCDALIAVTGRDQDNLIACQTAKQRFGITRVFARSNNPKNTAIMKKLGIDITVSATQTLANLIEHEIGDAEVKFIMNVNEGAAVVSEYRIPEDWRCSGMSLKELGIPENCVIISVMRGRDMIIPRGSTAVVSGDEILALTIGSAARKLKKLFA